ncbi:MAG: hypothetical protein OEY79_02815 [Anaplasmataceae bacterium]|nr:hypothetical protein [Anaplasmataceae bacterium]
MYSKNLILVDKNIWLPNIINDKLIIVSNYLANDIDKVYIYKCLNKNSPYICDGHEDSKAVDVTIFNLDEKFKIYAKYNDFCYGNPYFEKYLLLRGAMTAVGFKNCKSRWWHFSLPTT